MVYCLWHQQTIERPSNARTPRRLPSNIHHHYQTVVGCAYTGVKLEGNMGIKPLLHMRTEYGAKVKLNFFRFV